MDCTHCRGGQTIHWTKNFDSYLLFIGSKKTDIMTMFHKWTVTGFSLSLGRPDHGCHPLQRGQIPSSELLMVGHFMYDKIRLSTFNQVRTNKMDERFGNPIGKLQIEVDPNNK